MKQLTPDEFNDLGYGPHDARQVGVPPDAWRYRVQVWMENVYGWECCYSRRGRWISWRTDQFDDYERYPIWHKLPKEIITKE